MTEPRLSELRPRGVPSPSELTIDGALAAGMLKAGAGCVVSRLAVFRPTDAVASARPIVLGDQVEIGAYTVVHGGVVLGHGCRLEDHCVIGQPERGYAVRQHYAGSGASTSLEAGCVVRAGGIIYAGAFIGARTTVGHHTVMRSHVQVGADCSLGHLMTIERCVRIGARVRCSPGTHLTSDTELGDDAFLGSGVRTINDNDLDWRVGGGSAPLTPPSFDEGARVGSGAVILGGVHIGAWSLVGAGAVVTRDVPQDTVVVGNPAKITSSRRSQGD